MNAKSIEQLVEQVTGVSVGDGTDYPSAFEGYGGEAGMLQIRETLLDEDGIITGDFDVFEGTLLDVIQGAAAEGGKFAFINIEGITAADAAFVLSDPKYVEDATEIASIDGDLNINGIDYVLSGGKFVEFDS
jgi:hypothetical protein